MLTLAFLTSSPVILYNFPNVGYPSYATDLDPTQTFAIPFFIRKSKSFELRFSLLVFLFNAIETKSLKTLFMTLSWSKFLFLANSWLIYGI